MQNLKGLASKIDGAAKIVREGKDVWDRVQRAPAVEGAGSVCVVRFSKDRLSED